MSRIHAHRLIDAATVTENLLPMGNKLPDSERQVRPLTKLEPEQHRGIRFEEYCREHWQMNRNYANKLIAASEVIANLGTMVPILPETERQA